MKKVVIQFAITVLIFLGTWLVLGQYNWMELFEVETSRGQLEEKLGSLMIKDLEDRGMLVEEEVVQKVLDSLLVNLSEENNLDHESIRIYVSADSQVNAFALPDRQMVINKGLLSRVNKPEELAGVMAHELVHIRNNHVMKKLVRELGLGLLVNMTSGGAGSDAVRQLGHMLSSRAFDRDLEEEADTEAAQILNNCGVSAEHLANFLYLMAEYSGEQPDVLVWLSTHPELKSRAEHILEIQSELEKEVPIMLGVHWTQLQEFARE